ncbi:MAG: hypothetical protein ACO1TE_06050 [Prosthecobacter sp.]
MAFPRRHTRKITVDGIDYLWHLNHNDVTFGQTQITIACADQPKWFLHLDPYPCIAGVYEIGPATVRRAILWALSLGWQPAVAHEPTFISYRDGAFLALPYKERMNYPEFGRFAALAAIWDAGIPAETFLTKASA